MADATEEGVTVASWVAAGERGGVSAGAAVWVAAVVDLGVCDGCCVSVVESGSGVPGVASGEAQAATRSRPKASRAAGTKYARYND